MESHGVTVRSMRMLRGPNVHAYMPVMQIVLDVGPYEDRPSTTFPGCIERFLAWLPGLQSHQCSLGYPGGFAERLRRGTYLAHICEHVALELQCMMGFNVAFGRAREAGERGVYTVVVAFEEEEPARAAFATALRLSLAALENEDFDIEAERDQLLALADEYRLGPSTAAIVAAARARDIPVMRLTPTSSLVQLGYGVHQKRIQASEASTTSAIAVDMCQDKSLTNQMLRAVGVPVPDGQMVTSEEAAMGAADEIGFPVVVKPAGGNQGKGVSVNVRSAAEIRAAFELARDYSSEVLVERYIPGADFRLLVVNGQLVAASRRDPPQVVGDGQRTVTQLVEVVNRDPRRRPGHSSTLSRIPLDGAVDFVLQQQGLGRDTIPDMGQVVNLRTNCNLSTGGTATDVTDEVHPRVEVAVLETARGGILRAGLAFDTCTVGVVTNVSADHLGIGGIHTVEELARVKQVVVEAVRRDGAAVLNADDALVAEMVAATDAEVVYFGWCAQQHVIAAHLAEGGRAVFVDGPAIVLAAGRERIMLVELDRVAFTAGGKIPFQVQNALAATAAAWAAGLNPALIARALSTFTSDTAMVPGRFNLREHNGVQLIVDYGHNPAAMRALAEAVKALGRRRTLMALGLPGDRRDEDLFATIDATVEFADAYVLYDLHDRRGRDVHEVPKLLQQRLPKDASCTIVPDQAAAIQQIWQCVMPGDRLVLTVDEVDDALALIESLTHDATCAVAAGAGGAAW